MSPWTKILLALAALLWLALSIKLARAHEWYEADCCDEEDCRPALEGEVVDDWENQRFIVAPRFLHDGVTPAPGPQTQAYPYDYDRTRWKAADGRYHICIWTGSGDGSALGSQGGPVTGTRCVYAPPRGM